MFTGVAGGYLQASRRVQIAAALKGRDIHSDKVSDRNDATGSSSLTPKETEQSGRQSSCIADSCRVFL